MIEHPGRSRGGGEEAGGEFCEELSCSRREQSRSPSDLVMRPHWAADRGSTRANLSCASWVGVQVEQKICSSSQAWGQVRSGQVRSGHCPYLMDPRERDLVENKL